MRRIDGLIFALALSFLALQMQAVNFTVGLPTTTIPAFNALAVNLSISTSITSALGSLSSNSYFESNAPVIQNSLQPISLSVATLDNLTPLSANQIHSEISLLGNSIGANVTSSIVVLNSSVKLPYGILKPQLAKYASAGSNFRYLAY